MQWSLTLKNAVSLETGDTIVEPTAGNTGLGLSIVGIAKGYPVVLTMPENVSSEKYELLSAFGAKIVLTPEHGGMASAIWEAESIVRQNPRHYIPNQFTNPANPEIHRRTTAVEILKAIGTDIDFFCYRGRHRRYADRRWRGFKDRMPECESGCCGTERFSGAFWR